MAKTNAYKYRQDGIALITVLILLVAMTLLALGLTRTTDTSIQIANNISFRQSTLLAGDSGLQEAYIALRDSITDKLHDNSALGYYATEKAGADVTGGETPGNPADDVDWTGGENGLLSARRGADVDGVKIAYIITRMCDKEGKPDQADDGLPNFCAEYTRTNTGGSSKSAAEYGKQPLAGKREIYYRITVRAEGPRNSVSYVQSQVLVPYQ